MEGTLDKFVGDAAQQHAGARLPSWRGGLPMCDEKKAVLAALDDMAEAGSPGINWRRGGAFRAQAYLWNQVHRSRCGGNVGAPDSRPDYTAILRGYGKQLPGWSPMPPGERFTYHQLLQMRWREGLMQGHRQHPAEEGKSRIPGAGAAEGSLLAEGEKAPAEYQCQRQRQLSIGKGDGI